MYAFLPHHLPNSRNKQPPNSQKVKLLYRAKHFFKSTQKEIFYHFSSIVHPHGENFLSDTQSEIRKQFKRIRAIIYAIPGGGRRMSHARRRREKERKRNLWGGDGGPDPAWQNLNFRFSSTTPINKNLFIRSNK